MNEYAESLHSLTTSVRRNAQHNTAVDNHQSLISSFST